MWGEEDEVYMQVGVGGCVCVRSVSHTICCLFSGVWEAEGGCAESTK